MHYMQFIKLKGTVGVVLGDHRFKKECMSDLQWFPIYIFFSVHINTMKTTFLKVLISNKLFLNQKLIDSFSLFLCLCVSMLFKSLVEIKFLSRLRCIGMYYDDCTCTFPHSRTHLSDRVTLG